MAADTSNDERRTYGAIQQIIDAMLEFDKDTRTRMLKTVATFFSIDFLSQPETKSNAIDTSDTSQANPPPFSNREDLSPKDFLVQKKPRTDVERIACLAFYLLHYRNIPHFRTTEISKLNTEAAQIKFSNASKAVNNATQSGFLVAATKGAKQLSAPGEQFVDRLPDYATARKVMSELKPRRRKKTSSKNSEPTIDKREIPKNG